MPPPLEEGGRRAKLRRPLQRAPDSTQDKDFDLAGGAGMGGGGVEGRMFDPKTGPRGGQEFGRNSCSKKQEQMESKRFRRTSTFRDLRDFRRGGRRDRFSSEAASARNFGPLREKPANLSVAIRRRELGQV